ncbi:MAG: hypothetical protein JW724_02245 [Candidatus Altiarchaeota archaeon]|nr:hypothetical protein [Candidatus Altiarchaeota archaeon]
MACFSAPAAVAVVTTLFRKSIPEKYHINWLNTMLWGGTAGLALEHVAHGEIVASFPFLTAMSSAAETAVMIEEILTVGTGMLVLCLVAWGVMVAAAWAIEARTSSDVKQTV